MEKSLFYTYSNNTAGYCLHHQCGVTVRQMKCKNCLQKQCRHFIKNESHGYWKQKKLIEEKKRAKKQALNEYLMLVYNRG